MRYLLITCLKPQIFWYYYIAIIQQTINDTNVSYKERYKRLWQMIPNPLLYLLPLPFPFFDVDADGCDACSLELCLPWRVFNFGIVVPTYAKRESLVGNSDSIGVPSSFFNCTRIRPRYRGSLLRSFGCSLFSTPTL